VRKNPDRFKGYGRIVPCFDSIQSALFLFERALITEDGVIEVAKQIAGQHRRRSTNLLRSAADMLERGLLAGQTIELIWPRLQAEALAPSFFSINHDDLPSPRPFDREDGFLTPDVLRQP